MRTRCIGHAGLEIEAGGLRFLTDPWWVGGAYTRQWHAWPTPQPAGVESRPIDYLYISHGHEDHLHLPTLKTLRPGAAALVPEFLNGSFGSLLRDDLGFCQVVELRHGRPVTLRRGVRATCYVNVTDSMLVLEDGDRVLVNANDALHASSPTVIDYFCRLIRRNHPSVDTLYLGFSGASWFPNCVRVPGKHDRSVARAREELFAENFLRVVDALRPRIACAFAASFVLVDPQLRWINEAKLSVETPDRLYARRRPSGGTRVHLLLPNDVVDDMDITPGGVPRPSPETLDAALHGALREEVDRAEHLTPLPPDALRDLVHRLDARVRSNDGRLGRQPPFSIELRLRDNPGIALHIDRNRRGTRAALGVPRRTGVSLDLKAEILEAALRDEYGIESIVIGYGAVATLDRPEEFSRIQQLFALLSPRPAGWKAITAGLRQNPLRTIENAWRQRMPIALTLGARLGMIQHPYELRHLGAAATEEPAREAA